MAYESRFESFASFSANAGERKPRSPAAWDADLRRRMGAVGAQRAREEFHAAAVVGSLEQLYERLLADARHSQ